LKLLHESNEDQRRGWNVRKKVKWSYCAFFHEEIDAQDECFPQDRGKDEGEEEA
jgi:hypothetical protein